MNKFYKAIPKNIPDENSIAKFKRKFKIPIRIRIENKQFQLI